MTPFSTFPAKISPTPYIGWLWWPHPMPHLSTSENPIPGSAKFGRSNEHDYETFQKAEFVRTHLWVSKKRIPILNQSKNVKFPHSPAPPRVLLWFFLFSHWFPSLAPTVLLNPLGFSKNRLNPLDFDDHTPTHLSTGEMWPTFLLCFSGILGD